jgi:hypothetical protein
MKGKIFAFFFFEGKGEEEELSRQWGLGNFSFTQKQCHVARVVNG